MEVESQSFYRNSYHCKILVTGASGFIGSRLLIQLIRIDGEKKNTGEGNYSIRCLTRNKNVFDTNPLKRNDKQSSVVVVEGDLSNYDDCVKALRDVDIAYYLVHSMEGSSKNWKRFSQNEKKTTENFAKAADKCGVKRIIYLGGLTYGKEAELSPICSVGNMLGIFSKNRIQR